MSGRLPAGFVYPQSVIDGTVRVNSFVRVVGHITDYQAPIPTKGKDYKCALKLSDPTTGCAGSLVVNVFRQEGDMPEVTGGDVVVVIDAKVQERHGAFSLIANSSTEFHMYSGPLIPEPPEPASQAHRPPRLANYHPSLDVHLYVSWLHGTDKENIVEAAVLSAAADQSIRVRDKFSLLSDVREHNYYDIIVFVLRTPWYGDDGKATLWVTDYTENSSFFEKNGGHEDDDPYGIHARWGEHSVWTPPGRHCLQVTCYSPHSEWLRRGEVKQGEWVRISNVHIKSGRNGANLEGVLHQDRQKPDTVQIRLLDDDNDEEDTRDPGLKSALRRKYAAERAWEVANGRSVKPPNGSSGNRSGKKRKAKKCEDPDDPPRSSKLPRVEGRPDPEKVRAEAEQRRAIEQRREKKREQKTGPPLPHLDLNRQIKCENGTEKVSSVQDMLDPVTYTTTVDGNRVELELPFANLCYMAHVRVVDFDPPSLRDFAVRQRVDHVTLPGDGDSEDELDGAESFGSSPSLPKWEWRFWLCLEDAHKKGSTIWVLVNNDATEYLTGLKAVNLREDLETLEKLQQYLFLLWGEVEEAKAARQDGRRYLGGSAAHPPASSPCPPSQAGGTPGVGAGEKEGDGVASQAFACCIRQYGVRVPEADPRKCNADPASRWQRVFGLYGTLIRKI